MSEIKIDFNKLLLKVWDETVSDLSEALFGYQVIQIKAKKIKIDLEMKLV